MTVADVDVIKTIYRQKTILFSHVNQTTSTNSDLLNWVKKEFEEDIIVLSTDQQTAGRGTRGREWKMPQEALLFSVAVPLSVPLNRYIGVTLSIGMKMVRFLRLQGIDAYLKWPNDILVNQRKIAGILVENTKNSVGVDTLIIGIGLNLKQVDFQLDEYSACAVSDFVDFCWNNSLKKEWIGSMVKDIVDSIDEIQSEGMTKTVTEWKNVAAYQNELIDLYQDGEFVCSAIQHGIDESGRLLVSTPDGVRSFMSGTIRLRKK